MMVERSLDTMILKEDYLEQKYLALPELPSPLGTSPVHPLKYKL
jgi:hypothetical protein